MDEGSGDLREVVRWAEHLESLGENAEAEAAFRRATSSVESDVEAAAWRGVAKYAIERGDHEEGMAALERIVATGDPVEAPRALRNIGSFKEDIFGDVDGARAAYEASIALDHPLHSQGARVNLGQLLESQGDLRGAELLFREVVESGHPVESGRARTLLGSLLASAGDEQGALALFRQTMSEDPTGEWGQRSAFNAGDIFFRRGELDRAADAFAIAERIDEPGGAALAAFLTGEIARRLGREEEALGAYTRVFAGEGVPSSVTAAAAKQAGMIHFGRRDGAAAGRLFRLAADVDDGEEGARGAMLLAICERQMGDRAAAIAACELASSKSGAPPDVLERARQLMTELR